MSGSDTRTFDWKPRFDERSRNYPIRSLLEKSTLRSNAWSCEPRLDQGREGACVGFGWSHELAANPVVVPGITNDFARNIYHQAQTLDEWAGEDYDGTSVLAGAKTVQSLGYVREYRWAFGLQDVLAALSYHGPVVLGLNWYEGMWDTDEKGFIHVTGSLVGGHCILARGLAVKSKYVTLRNSWGNDWGTDGDCRILFTDLERLLSESGEACVPVRRSKSSQ